MWRDTYVEFCRDPDDRMPVLQSLALYCESEVVLGDIDVITSILKKQGEPDLFYYLAEAVVGLNYPVYYSYGYSEKGMAYHLITDDADYVLPRFGIKNVDYPDRCSSTLDGAMLHHLTTMRVAGLIIGEVKSSNDNIGLYSMMLGGSVCDELVRGIQGWI